MGTITTLEILTNLSNVLGQRNAFHGQQAQEVLACLGKASADTVPGLAARLTELTARQSESAQCKYEIDFIINCMAGGK